MKLALIIILLFVKNCQNEELKNSTAEDNKKVLIEYSEPLNGFTIKIDWILKDSITDRQTVFGPAIIELKRKSDNKIFRINQEKFKLNDTIYKDIVYESFKNKSVSNILRLKTCQELYFKDINFDNNVELILKSSTYDDEIRKTVLEHRIFELINNELTEIHYFPVEALDWSGTVDYENKEIVIREYINCCSYNASYYKFDKNNKEKFIYYKSQYYSINTETGEEEIIIDEEGKPIEEILKKK